MKEKEAYRGGTDGRAVRWWRRGGGSEVAAPPPSSPARPNEEMGNREEEMATGSIDMASKERGGSKDPFAPPLNSFKES